MESKTVPIVRNAAALRTIVRTWKAEGQSVALVPTMGALHEGHLSLVRQARAKADKVIVSIFVNPTQFAPHEDFDRYPRTEQSDVDSLRRDGAADVVFAPAPREMYPPGFSTTVNVAGPALGLESDARPHFFNGVATVVVKLLLQADPDVALFGEKDYQQLLVIKRLATDLNVPVQIIGCTTLREADGLAMSSRNAYLTKTQRHVAAKLNVSLFALAQKVRAGGEPKIATAQTKIELLNAGFNAIDYLEVRDAETLSAALCRENAWRVLGAVRLGEVRLIDNCAA
jgi:pantoate--beta-alanine ligase